MTPWAAYILAGGRGRRLDGRVKPLVAVSGRTILDRQVDACLMLGVRPVLVAPDATPFAATGLEVVADDVAAGALGGLYTALTHSPTSYALVLAGDMPFVTAPFLRYLLDLTADHDAVVPCVAGRWHPLCAVYHRRVAPHLRTAIDAGRWRVTDAVTSLAVRAVTAEEMAPFDAGHRLLLNVNTPEDHGRAEAHALV